jgi:signal transduction histidine kinase
MTGIFWLDWASLTLSLVNTILLFWLGTTVLINVEQRSWGGWLAAAGLYSGGIFFVSHTAILGYGLRIVSTGTLLWWSVGLLVVTLLPFLWYVMMLWYSGYWERQPGDGPNALVRRHRLWLLLCGAAVIALGVIGLLVHREPIPDAYPMRGLEESVPVAGLPVALVVFPLYVLLCMALSLDAVLRPGPFERMMGEQARDNARPWLVAASGALLLVSFGVLGVFWWMSGLIGGEALQSGDLVVIGLFDVVIEGLIALAVGLVGQAVATYEVFTGQSLPRRGFRRQWQLAIGIALGFGAVIAFVFTAELKPIYGILLATLLMTFFLALLSWRTVTERQRTIASLRPFVTSQRGMEQLLSGETEDRRGERYRHPFEALCREVLDTEAAYLVPLGPMAPLLGEPLTYSAPGREMELPLPPEAVQPIVARMAAGIRMETPLEAFAPPEAPQLGWLVPLWSQRGLAGALVLGPKRDGGIYSREEIEVAQSSGERLIDTQASLEIARRLMAIQRERLVQNQVMDQRPRRTLHDEVLPDLHAAILKLSALEAGDKVGLAGVIAELTDVHREIAGLLRGMPGTSRIDPAEAGLAAALETAVREAIGGGFDEVHWEISPEAAAACQRLTALEAEVIYHAAREGVRNASRHGRTGGDRRALHLSVRLEVRDGLRVEVEDDGVGISSVGEESGGQGLALHRAMMAVIGGELLVESQAGQFTRVTLRLPGVPV